MSNGTDSEYKPPGLLDTIPQALLFQPTTTQNVETAVAKPIAPTITEDVEIIKAVEPEVIELD